MADTGAARPQPAQADDYWTFQPASAHHDEEFPAHDFQTRFPGTLKEHPHCTRCHVPEGSSESKWLDGRCTLRTFLTIPAHIVKAAALSSPSVADSPTPQRMRVLGVVYPAVDDGQIVGTTTSPAAASPQDR